MSVIVGAIKTRWIEILPGGERSLPLFFASGIITLITMSAAATLGYKSIFILAILLILFAAISYSRFLPYLFLGLLPITTYMFWNSKTYLNYSIGGLILFLWILRRLIQDDKRLEFSPKLISFMIAFLFFAFLSAINKGVTKGEAAALTRFLFFFSFVIVLYDTFRPRDIFWIMAALTLPLLFELYYIIITFIKAGDPTAMLIMYRFKPTGFFDNANNYGAAVICVLPFWAAISIWGKKRYLKRITIVLSFILLFALALSNARAAFLGILLATILFSYWAGKLKHLLLVLAVGLFLFMSIPMLNVVISVALRSDFGTTNRTEIWGNVLKMIAKNPWLGVGVGNFSSEYMQYFPTVGMRNFFVALSHAHNQILSKTAELGIPGLFLILALYFLPAKAGIKAIKKIQGFDGRILIYGVFGGIIAMYGRSLFETGMMGEGSFYPDIVFWTLLIAILKIDSTLKNDLKDPFIGMIS